MNITKVKIGKAIRVNYEEGIDKKTITSKEVARPEFYAAFSEIALEIKTIMAEALGYEGKDCEEYIQRNKLRIEAISFRYDEETGNVESYEVWGDHFIEGTPWFTDIHLGFQFGNERPDKSALRILKETEKYVDNKRAQMSLFEAPDELKDWKVTKVE